MSVTARHIIKHLDGHVASNPGRARAHADGAATQAIGQLPLGVKALNTHPVKSVPGVRSALMIAHIIVAPRLHLMTLRWCPSYSSATTVSLLAACLAEQHKRFDGERDIEVCVAACCPSCSCMCALLPVGAVARLLFVCSWSA